jgi:ADP-ribose pyrophosphatase
VNKPDSPVEVNVSDHGDQTYISIRHRSGKPSVAMLVRANSKFLLLSIKRQLIGPDLQLEIPRGFGELATPRDDARRELAEETGLQALEITELGRLNADSGLIDNTTVIFLTTVLDTQFTPSIDEGIIAAHWYTLEELDQLISSGQITDSYTIAALKFYGIQENSQTSTSSGILDSPLKDFFLNDTMDNMRHTEAKQLQLAVGTIGAFALVISTVIEKGNTDAIFGLTAKNLGATIGLTIWSTAATTKLFRYRAWKEHYSKKVREMTGPYFVTSAPVIYAPLAQNDMTGKVNIKKRLFGDETLTLICVLLNVLSAIFLSSFLVRVTWESSLHEVAQVAITASVLGAFFYLLVRLHKSAYFQISEESFRN